MARQDDWVRLQLRLPRELHAQISDDATASGMSMNSEIVRLLTAASQAQRDFGPIRSAPGSVEAAEAISAMVATLQLKLDEIVNSLLAQRQPAQFDAKD